MPPAIPLVFFGIASLQQLDSEFVDLGQHIIHSEMPVHTKNLEPVRITFEVFRYLVDADILDSVG
jgi:hypothetical protein